MSRDGRTVTARRGVALVVPLVIVAACGEQGTRPTEPAPPAPPPPVNQAPQAIGTIPAQIVVIGETTAVRVGEYFRDEHHSGLKYAAAISDSFATVSMSGSTVFIDGTSRGDGTVTVTAEDVGGLTATQSFQLRAKLSERAVLRVLYRATGGEEWNQNDNWLSRGSIGNWHGVRLGSTGSVERLGLSHNNLTGPIPPELADLSGLKDLFLRGNNLTGPIPPDLGNLESLERITLNENALSGSIPIELAGLSNLRYLWLDRNELTGPIPRELGQLASLVNVNLGANRLAGSLPPEFGDLSNLSSLTLFENELVGPIPLSLVGLTRLSRFDWADNPGLCAPRTQEFEDWLAGLERRRGPPCDLETVRAALVALYEATDGPNWKRSDNWLTQTLVREWYGVQVDRETGAVDILDLADNNLTGSIPAELGDLTALRWLFLSRNYLSGPFPAPLGNLTNLEILGLSDNGLTGPIPTELMGLPRLRWFRWIDSGLCAPRTEAFAGWLAGFFSSSSYWRWTVCGEAAPGFQIELDDTADVPPDLLAAAEAAADYWMRILAATELPDRAGPGDPCGDLSPSIVDKPVRTIDDVVITLAVVELDGHAAARAGPCAPTVRLRDPLNARRNLPLRGRVEVDPSWESWSVPVRQAVMRHELAHVLGIGSGFEWRDRLVDPTPTDGPSLDTHFSGPLAVEAFNRAGGTTYSGERVPVENRPNRVGSANSHWRNSVFGRGRELMTTLGGPESALSTITLQALADMGYDVDLSFADPYTLPTAADVAGDGRSLIDLHGDVLDPRPLILDLSEELNRLRTARPRPDRPE